MKGRSVRGGAVTMLAQGVQFLLIIGSTVVLARLLTPDDFGLIVMVTAITGFVTMFKDLGLAMATVQKTEINHAQVSTLFWINVLISFLIMLATATLAPAIAWFYGEPRLTWIVVALASAFIFGGLTVQHQALLRRQMRFGTLASIQIISRAVGVAAAIFSAWCGADYWALVIMRLAEATAGAAAVWLACGWRPGWPARHSGVRKMLAFGGYLTGFNLVNYFARNGDNILLGRFCGSHVLGLYSKAYNLFMLPITQIRIPLAAVAMPALSRMQNQPDKCAKYYYRFVSVLSFITMPFAGFIFVCSENIIRLSLGESWLGANAIFKILSIVGFIQAVETTQDLIMLSSGKSKRFFIYGAVRSTFLVLSFAAGVSWGGRGVAAGFAIGDYLILFPALWYCFRGTQVSVTGFLRAVAQPAIASLISTAVMFLTHLRFLLEQHDVVAIGVCLLVGVLSYLGALAIMPGGPATLREFFSHLFLVFRNRRNTKQDTSPAAIM
ncbi:MAG: lipopolysaccharide biosynthesis protein [Planctomycetota bacterium]